MWTASLSSILDGKTNPWAIRFVSTGLSILSTSSPGKRRTRTPEATSARENPALQTLIGVLGAISAMAMLSQNFGSAAGMAEKQRQDRTQKVVLQVVGEAIALVMSQGGGRESSYPLLLAAFLSSDTIETLGIATKTALQTIWFQENQARETSGMAKQPQLHSSTVALVCSIAHCCSKATSQPSSHYFAAVCKLAEELQIPRLRELRTDGAFLLAQETDDLRDLIFAETLMGGSPSEKGFTRHHRPRGALFSGYRWEEGISEWIAMSPAKRREIIANNDTVLRRSSRSGRGKKNASVVYSGPELSAEAAGAADESGPQMSMNEPDGSSGHHVDRRRAGKRKAVHDGPRVHNSRLEKDKAQNQLGNGVDELSATFQENHLGKSRLGSTAVKTWGGSQRRTRTGKTGRRKALADLTILTNVTGLDDDELGL
ncbi:hypothetical protein CkaCkLH20_07041 [Colletotrichum karsti]|uniref:Uncharacterized protein n=1 Tax=Colletotrichum karsti TaxID=1095194 RepID=A0A9P6I4G2_9PEZI|nr:uncharacterized protein CkaCkLH20_07041 [Colletotrichum karsti]KAF9875660.1 hypothetical protein CkaCkLH20_07041 [Colletotrichum karsti]